MIDHVLAQLLDRLRPMASGRTSPGVRARFDTSDIVQEAAIQLLGDIEKNGSESYTTSRPLLSRIVRGHAYKLWRHHTAAKRNASLDCSPVDHCAESATPDDLAAAGEMAGKLAIAIGKLNADERFIIDEYVKHGNSFNTIAELIDRPPHWVRRTYKRAIKQLRGHLADNDD